MEKDTTKVCTQCHETKEMGDYYSLGKARLDSRCKACRKTKRVIRYKPQKQSQNYGNLLKLLDFILAIELSELDSYERRLQEIIDNVGHATSSSF